MWPVGRLGQTRLVALSAGRGASRGAGSRRRSRAGPGTGALARVVGKRRAAARERAGGVQSRRRFRGCAMAAAGTARRGGASSTVARDARLDDRGLQKRDSSIGQSPVKRGRPSSRLHLVCDGRGVPLALSVAPGNRHDRVHALATLDADRLRSAAATPEQTNNLRRPGYDADCSRRPTSAASTLIAQRAEPTQRRTHGVRRRQRRLTTNAPTWNDDPALPARQLRRRTSSSPPIQRRF